MCENNTILAEPSTIMISNTRIQKTSPDGYRLGKRKNGEYVLQGAFFWQEENKCGHDWRDLETIPLP
jgi:hypothetical protein